MSLSQLERETIISFTRQEANLYTSQPEVWQKIEKVKGFKLLEEGKINGKVISKSFEFPKAFVRFTKRGLVIASPRKARPLTEKQRETLSKAGFKSKSHVNIVSPETTEPTHCGLVRQEAEREESHV